MFAESPVAGDGPGRDLRREGNLTPVTTVTVTLLGNFNGTPLAIGYVTHFGLSFKATVSKLPCSESGSDGPGPGGRGCTGRWQAAPGPQAAAAPSRSPTRSSSPSPTCDLKTAAATAAVLDSDSESESVLFAGPGAVGVTVGPSHESGPSHAGSGVTDHDKHPGLGVG